MTDFNDQIEDFYKRWEIIDNKKYNQRIADFKIRISNIFEYIDRNVSSDDIGEFCNAMAVSEIWHQSTIDPYSTNIIDTIYGAQNEKELYKVLELVLNLPSLNNRGKYIEDLKKAINYSKINLSITVQDGKVILYRKGEKYLDEKLVDEVLSFLPEKAKAHFIDSLNFYQGNKKSFFIKAAESLRRSAEEFLREKLSNNQGLKRNIIELQTALKTREKESNIRKISFQVLSYLDDYFNKNSKHADGEIDENECEYLIYQTGVIFRYLDKILTK